MTEYELQDAYKLTREVNRATNFLHAVKTLAVTLAITISTIVGVAEFISYKLHLPHLLPAIFGSGESAKPPPPPPPAPPRPTPRPRRCGNASRSNLRPAPTPVMRDIKNPGCTCPAEAPSKEHEPSVENHEP